MIDRNGLGGNSVTAIYEPKKGKNLNSVYCRLKKMLINYEFRPGQQLHIAELVETLSTSTTPLREALMRLQAERLVTATPNKGFFAKTLSSKEMSAWYEAAFLVLKYSIQCASRSNRPWGNTGSISVWLPMRPLAKDPNLIEICAAKESLYEDISRWSGNQVMLEQIRDFNTHSRFVRMLDLEIPENIEAITDDMIQLGMALRDLDAESAIANLEGQLKKKLGRLDLLAKEGTVRSLGFASIPNQSFDRHPII